MHRTGIEADVSIEPTANMDIGATYVDGEHWLLALVQLNVSVYRGGGGILYGDFSRGKIPHEENSAPVPKNQRENSAPPKSSVHWKQKGSWDCDPNNHCA